LFESHWYVNVGWGSQVPVCAVRVWPSIAVPVIVGVGDWVKGIVLATAEVAAETKDVEA
jgi:hypothetical protein